MDSVLRFFFCERFYWPLLDFWSLNFKRWIRVFKLLVKPAEERSKGHPNITNRFLGQWFCAAVEPNWLIVSAQPSQIFSEIRGAYFTYITIADMRIFSVICDEIFYYASKIRFSFDMKIKTI